MLPARYDDDDDEDHYTILYYVKLIFQLLFKKVGTSFGKNMVSH